MEWAPTVHQFTDHPITQLEALVRRIWQEALSGNMGSQRARELIVERLEGKAPRGEAPKTANTTLEEQLEKTEVDLLNSLTKDDDAISQR